MRVAFLLSAFLFFIISNLFSQDFTRITTGDIVNDGTFTEGALWGDYDNDGDLDIFFANITGQNNMLFENNGDGTFTRITTGDIVNDGGFSYGGCWGDYNGDGYLDLFSINGGFNVAANNNLYINNTDGTFTKITTGVIVSDGGRTWSSCAADYDNDGDLDIFTSNINQNNSLYRNNGDATFTKITTGDVVSDGGSSLGSAWGDYDNDGYPDLFVANSNFGAGEVNFLYKNNGNGTFTRITTGDIATEVANSVAASWGDYNDDGNLDLFVTNYSGENNFLYKNNGDGTFTKITSGVLVNDGGTSVGSAWGDYDNDGDLDIFVSNDVGENNTLYQNDGDTTFTKITTGAIVSDGGSSNGPAWCDYDSDGDLDLVVVNGAQAPVQNNYLYRNDNSNGNSWVNIKCIGVTSNTSAIGVKLSVKAQVRGASSWQYREILSQTGYNSENSLNVEFGLGSAPVVDSMVIVWPSGTVETYTNIDVNRFLTATEGSGIVGVHSTGNEIPERFTLEQNYPNPFNPSTNIKFNVKNLKFIELKVFDVNGREVAVLVNEELQPGSYEYKFDGAGLSSGIYFYTLSVTSAEEKGVAEFIQTRKMILIK